MKLKIIYLFIFLFIQTTFSQNGFLLESKKSKITIPFKLLNNLVIIPIEVNGVTLNFLLDTGVEESILFSLDESDEVSFSKIEKIKIKGFGSKEPFDGFKSTKNILKTKEFIDNNHTLYLVLDQDINISSQIGIPVNGIIGYHFFQNNCVKINYINKKITIYKSDKEFSKTQNQYSKTPLQFHDGKPYIIGKTTFETSNELQTKLLIDTGNTDAIWLFKEKSNQIVLPKINFDDFLGKGFSGDVFGKRGRIKTFELGDFKLNNPLVAFPDAVSTTDIDTIQNRLGSIGAEVMKRFTVVFDYKNQVLYLKKNSNFNNPFQFNMSGIEIQHQGLQWISESYEENPALANNFFDVEGNKISNNLKYKFLLKPIYVIGNIRKDSPADLSGLKKGDVIVKINSKNGYNFSLQDINDLLKSEEGKTIKFEVERKTQTLKFEFQLKSML